MSMAAVKELYGVVIDPETFAVDVCGNRAAACIHAQSGGVNMTAVPMKQRKDFRRIGVLLPSSSSAQEWDIGRALPEDITLHVARMRLNNVDAEFDPADCPGNRDRESKTGRCRR